MKNLRLSDNVATQPLPDLADAIHATEDTDLGTVYVATATLLSAVDPLSQEVNMKSLL